MWTLCTYNGLKGGPSVARNFCLAQPGWCVAKQVHLLAHLCSTRKIHSVPVIWSSDIWSFRVYGQFLGGPNFALYYKIDHISRI